MLFLFIVPTSIIFLVLVGFVMSVFFMAIASTIIFLLLRKYNKFNEWKSDTRTLVRYAGYISYYGLIIMMILSYVGIGLTVYLYYA